MNPKDVNRINYNNYYVGKNLDFLVRSKMRSESLSTPLKNTPSFYDDQVSSKMSLLGKRGYYDPGYIYGFKDQPQNENSFKPEDIEQYEKERYKEEQKFLNNQKMDNIPINKYNDEMMYRERLNERQTPQQLDSFQLDRLEPNKEIKNYEQEKKYINNLETKGYEGKNNFKNNNNEYNDLYSDQIMNNNIMMRNEDKIPNQDYYQKINEYDYISEMARQNRTNLPMSLPLTKNQILQNIYSNKREHY